MEAIPGKTKGIKKASDPVPFSSDMVESEEMNNCRKLILWL